MKIRIGFGLLVVSAVLLQLALVSAGGLDSAPDEVRAEDQSRATGGGAVKACGVSYESTPPITINTSGKADPYPATVIVANQFSPLEDVIADLNNFSHTNPDDLDILLVGPQGQKVMLMSDAGGSGDLTQEAIRFTDAAPSAVPDAGPIPSGVSNYRPANYEPGESLPSPAPAGPYSTSFSVFDGTNPNGTWRLYINDDQGPDPEAGSVQLQIHLDSKCPKCLGFESHLVGSQGADIIDANLGAFIHARGGDDVITETSAKGNADAICGGAGDDTIKGGVGNDKLDGGVGDDNVQGGDGNDLVRGNRGRDVLRGNDGDDTLSGGLGVEQICSGGNGTDTANACDGNVSGVP